MKLKDKISSIIIGEELVPVREAQKNITKYFDKGLVRITKNGKSLGYLMSDESLKELIETIESNNPDFIERMKNIKNTKKRVSLNDTMKEFGLK